MNKIYSYWFSKSGNFGNFGDELGPYLIKKLSGQQVYKIIIPRSSIKLILAYLKGLFTNVYSLKMISNVIKTALLNGKYIITVGSIIGWGSGRRIVWGSGILFSNEKVDNGDFLAVRGKYTRDRLLELGYKCPEVYGDPALLLPIVFNPNIKKKYKLGLIPHHTQFDHFSKYALEHEIKVINLIGDIEQIIVEILECENIISSSLHGVIVSQAYNIPALWYEYPKIKWHGENIKFLDYFSSVGIKEYKPYLLKEIKEFNVNLELENFNTQETISTINIDLKTIQKGLLNVAPFPVLSQFNLKAK